MVELFRRASNVLILDADSGEPQISPDDKASNAKQARLELLENISSFICRYDLVPTPGNLALIGAALTGTNAQLSTTFAARQLSGKPIDQRWLDTLDRFNPASERRAAELEGLVEKLDDTLMRFSQSAQFARSETSEHRDEIDAQLAMISSNVDADSVQSEVERLVAISQAMIVRLEHIEATMERSRQETEDLRLSLAEARLEADVDHLTGLPNRRAFERRFASAAANARSRNEPLCIAFCDVDHFKKINDTHGHDAGDRVLKMIAATLNEHASADCFVARHGGEEFVLVLSRLDKAAAHKKVDSIRHSLALRNLSNRTTGKPFGKVTFSAGIAEIGDDADDRSALARADAALYRAKESGRNRVATG
jgi:diguanylate cyclase